MATYNGKELDLRAEAAVNMTLNWVNLQPGDGTRYEFGWGPCPRGVFPGVGDGSEYVVIATKFGFYTMNRGHLWLMSDSLDDPQVGYFMDHLDGLMLKKDGPGRTHRYTCYVILSYVREQLHTAAPGERRHEPIDLVDGLRMAVEDHQGERDEG